MNAKQTKDLIRNLPMYQSIMLAAKHGVGKSSVVKQVALENGGQFHDVRLSQCEIGDLKGLPYLDEAEGRTRFLKPWWWPKDPDSKGILFFDELNRASNEVLQAVFEICLDRRLDGEPLPAGWRVVAAINASDDYQVVEFDPALLDRWFYIDFDPTAKEWMTWATSNGVHPAIVDFIAQNEEYLDPPVGNLQVGQIYQSRRSWVQFHESMQALGIWDAPQEDAMITHLAKGWLGATVAITFAKFYQNDFSRLKAEDVLERFDEVKAKIEAASSDIEVIASLSRNLLDLVKKRTPAAITKDQMENLKGFFLMLPAEVAAQFWQTILSELRTEVLKWRKDEVLNAHLKKIFLTE